jgi:hypothetical protein
MSLGDWYVWVVIACAMCVPGLSQFRLHKTLLLEGVPARIVQWILLSIAAFGIANAAACHFDREAIGLAVALASPALHLLLFRVAFRWFVKKVGREPVDVTYNWTPGLAPDRAFAILFLLVCIFGTTIGALLVAGPSPKHPRRSAREEQPANMMLSSRPTSHPSGARMAAA